MTTKAETVGMYLVVVPERVSHVFSVEDPRGAGCTRPVIDNVGLDGEEFYDWPDGAVATEECLGVHPEQPRRFRLFRSDRNCREAGYAVVNSTCTVLPSWSGFPELVGLES